MGQVCDDKLDVLKQEGIGEEMYYQFLKTSEESLIILSSISRDKYGQAFKLFLAVRNDYIQFLDRHNLTEKSIDKKLTAPILKRIFSLAEQKGHILQRFDIDGNLIKPGVYS